MTVAHSILHNRTRDFAIAVLHFCSSLLRSPVANTLGNQVLRSGTSVGANLREAKRSRSRAEMISKMEISLQEIEETTYWFEILVATGVASEPTLKELVREADEITAMLVSSIKTLKQVSN